MLPEIYQQNSSITMMLASRSHSSGTGSSLTSPKTSRKKAAPSKGTKKCVRFQDHLLTVHPITPRSQFQKNQTASCYYNYDDYHMISQENNNILKFMMIGGEGIKHVETATSTTRGLECKTLEGAEHKKISILDGLCAVLLEQERQRQKDVVDEEKIREAYLAYTQVPAMMALKQGKLDSKSADNGGEALGAFGKAGNGKKHKAFDLQSTDTTLISDEFTSNGGSVDGDCMMGGGDSKKGRSIVKRLLKGRMFTKQRRKASSAAYKLGV